MALHNVNYISLSHTVNRSSRQGQVQYISQKRFYILVVSIIVVQWTLTPLALGRNQYDQPVAMVFQKNTQVVFELQPFTMTIVTEQKQTVLTLELFRVTIPNISNWC